MRADPAPSAAPDRRSGPVRAVFFDLDDTLFDHTTTCANALREVRRAEPSLRRRPFDQLLSRYSALLEQVQPDVIAGRTTRDEARDRRFVELFAYCHEQIRPSRAHEVSARYRAHYQSLRQAVPGATALLRAVRAVAQVGIISNNEVEEQEDKLAATGLADYVDFLVTSEEVRVGKPDPAIFSYALREAGVAAGQAVMMGDNWALDVQGAIRSGLRAVWFAREGQRRPSGGDGVPVVRSLDPTAPVLRILLRPPTFTSPKPRDSKS